MRCFAVQVGLNLQPGQDVLIIADVEHAELTRAVTRQAYAAGARHVEVDYKDARLTRIRADLAPDESLGWSPPHRVQQIRELGRQRAAVVQISGPPDPAVFEGVDGERLARNAEVEWRRTYLEQVSEGRFNWVIVAGPTRAWAERVFGEPNVDRLWRAIAEDRPARRARPAGRMARPRRPPAEACRRAHGAPLRRHAPARPGHRPADRAARGRDLGQRQREDRVGPPRTSRTCQTEEIFTTPHAARVDGTVRSTKPLVLIGRLVRDIEMRFEGGRAVEVRAAEGEDVLRESMSTDENAGRLGEIALVDNDSRVGRTGITTSSTPSSTRTRLRTSPTAKGCPDSIPGGRDLTWEEREERGVNHSGVHVDFMVGSPEVDVDGILRDGTAVPVMRGGDFTLS